MISQMTTARQDIFRSNKITWNSSAYLNSSIIVYIITCRGLVHSFMQWQIVPQVECSKFSSDGVLKIDETQKLGSAQMKHVSCCLKHVSGFVSAPAGECFSPLFYVFHFLKWTPDVLKIEPQKGINRAPTLSRERDQFLPRSIPSHIHILPVSSIQSSQFSSSQAQSLSHCLNKPLSLFNHPQKLSCLL